MFAVFSAAAIATFASSYKFANFVYVANVYVVSLPLNDSILPFVTVISSAVNPVTLSLNVIVYVMLLAFVISAVFAVIVAVGDVVSPVINANVRQQTARAHTATHLLQAALRSVLNEDVEQRGSKVSPDSVRFDFSFGRAMTAEEKQAVEDLINKWISADMPVLHEEMSMDDAVARGAMALFGEKYGDVVRVISAGDISCELCGGTHIHHTGEIIKARINKEKSISSGIRRITMSVGTLAE